MVLDALRTALECDSRIAYALVFGSSARAGAGAHSDVDVALGLAEGAASTRLDDLLELCDLLSRKAGG